MINKTSFSRCNLSLQSTLYIEKEYFGSKWSFFSGSSHTGMSEMQARSGERVNALIIIIFSHNYDNYDSCIKIIWN